MPANFNNFTHSPNVAPTDRVVGYANTQAGGERSFPATAFMLPPGMILAYAGQNPPPGWLPCDGRSTAGFPQLAAVVGPNVPDLRGYFIRGAGTNADGTASGAPGQKQPAYAGQNNFVTTTDDGDSQVNPADRRGEMQAMWVNGTQVGFGNVAGGQVRRWPPTGAIEVPTLPGDTRPKNIAFLYIIKA